MIEPIRQGSIGVHVAVSRGRSPGQEARSFLLASRSLQEEPPGHSLETLLQRIALKEEDALSTLYDRMSGRVHGIAMRVLKAPERAEEATLDAFTKIWNQAHQFRPSTGSAKVWIHAIARNSSLDILRKIARQAEREESHPEHDGTVAQAPSPETTLYRSEQNEIIFRAMAQLTNEQKRTILAAYFDGMTHSEIAKAFDQPLGTIKTRIRKSLEILRRALAATGELG